MDYIAAMGVDAGLLVARKREDVKNVRDSDQRTNSYKDSTKVQARRLET